MKIGHFIVAVFILGMVSFFFITAQEAARIRADFELEKACLQSGRDWVGGKCAAVVKK